MTDFMIAPLLLWLALCAYQDYRTGEVSNWLTLPPLVLSLAARTAGWLNASLWTITLVWLLALFLWHTGKLGGADAKAWMTFSLLGDGILWSAYFGLLIWYAAVVWAFRYQKTERARRLPGFPGYFLGVSGSALLLTIQHFFPIISPVAFILKGTLFSACGQNGAFFV